MGCAIGSDFTDIIGTPYHLAIAGKEQTESCIVKRKRLQAQVFELMVKVAAVNQNYGALLVA